MKTLFRLMVVLLGMPLLMAQDETRAQRDERMGWWRDAKFGMFIHWGVYSVPAGTYDGRKIDGIGEWIMLRGEIPVERYKQYAKEFNPVKYDPDAWVRLAKAAGMKYIVITSKHHDGFALFDSKVTDWDVVDATPYGKDLLKPLAEACRKHGMKLGFYYSQAQDWNHPGGAAARDGHWDKAQDGSMDEYIDKIAIPQVREILTSYGDVAVLWWDTPVDMTPERAKRLHPLLELQPGIISNNRLGGGFPGDTETPEQYIPATGFKDRDWEVCMTMNDTWGFKSYDHRWKPVDDLLRKLCDIASKGGNFLLNVGPTSEGEIPQPSIERLEAVGKWMDVNGEAIYGSAASPFGRLGWGRCTSRQADGKVILYPMVFDWPKDGMLLLPGLGSEVGSARVLAGGATLVAKRTDEGVVLSGLPATAPDPHVSVLRVELATPLEVKEVLPGPAADGVVTLSAKQAVIHNVFNADVRLEGGEEPHIGYWTAPKVKVDWRFTIPKPGTYQVSAVVAGESATRVKVSGGGKGGNVKIAPTGAFDQFADRPLGKVSFAEAGRNTLTLQPVAKAWKPLNLRRVVLTPVAKP